MPHSKAYKTFQKEEAGLTLRSQGKTCQRILQTRAFSLTQFSIPKLGPTMSCSRNQKDDSQPVLRANATPSSNLFFMTNLRPKRTGLQFVVYVSPKSHVAHGPRITASNKYGEKVSEGDWFTITIEDQPQAIGDSTGLKRCDVHMAKKWVQVNKDKLLKIWEDDVDVLEADLQQV